MAIKIINQCRGDGRGYIHLEIDGLENSAQIASKITLKNGSFVPSIVIDPENQEDACRQNGSRTIVVVFPLLSVTHLLMHIVVINEGETVNSFEHKIDMRKLKWLSKINYVLRKQQTLRLRDTEDSIPIGHASIVPTFFVDDTDSENSILRVSCTVPFRRESKLSMHALALDGNELPGPFILLGSEVRENEEIDSLSVQEISCSIKIPTSTNGICVYVVDDSNLVESAFMCLLPPSFQALKDDWRTKAANAAQFPGYDEWIRATSPTKQQLCLQRTCKHSVNAFFTFIVPVSAADIGLMEQTIKSIEGQSYGQWQICLVALDHEAFSELKKRRYEEKGSYIHLLEESDYSMSLMPRPIDIDDEYQYTGIVYPGDILEPNLLFECTSKMHKDSKVGIIYFDDDDLVDEHYLNPRFKPDFNFVLLLSTNYIGEFLFARNDLLNEIGLIPLRKMHLGIYKILLEMPRKEEAILHIQKVLHHRKHQSSLEQLLNDAKAQQEKTALESFFSREKLQVTMTNEKDPNSRKISFAISETPKISIIIPNKDQEQLICECVESIINKVTYPNFDITIVENNSTEKTTFAAYDKLQNLSDKVRIVFFPGSFNYSEIINFGAAHTDGEYLLLLNNDTKVITPHFLEEMMGYCTQKDVGVVGAKLLFRDETIQHAGVVVGPFTMAAHLNSGMPSDAPGYCERIALPQELSAVTGACQLVSRNVFEIVGGYDEKYQVEFNDVDFCLKIREHGYKVVYVPSAVLFHYEFSSRGKDLTAARMVRSFREKSLLNHRWAPYFIYGDPFYNPNLNKDGLYFGFGSLI